MKTRKVIDTETLDRFTFGIWDEEEGEFIPIEPSDKEHQKLLGCNELLLDVLRSSFEILVEAVADDLKDIWKRVS